MSRLPPTAHPELRRRLLEGTFNSPQVFECNTVVWRLTPSRSVEQLLGVDPRPAKASTNTNVAALMKLTGRTTTYAMANLDEKSLGGGHA